MFRKSICRYMSCCRNDVENITFIDYGHSLLREVPGDIFLYERTLENLQLSANHLEELPRQLFNCDELRILNLSDNQIKFLPPSISSLINLNKLDIGHNSIKTLPDNIKNCSHLHVLSLSSNPLYKLPECLVNLISLTELYLNDALLDFLPANFGKLVNLRILEVRDNVLSNFPKTLSRLVHLQRLDFGNNDFKILPEVVSSLHNLTELIIDLNCISKLPASIGQLRKMIHFEASHNFIETLPRDVGYWTRIVELSMSGNSLINLPTTIGNMKNLIVLKLDDNNIKSLPNTIGKLTNLEELMLTRNCLPELPESIGLLRKLKILNVDQNYLIKLPKELGSCNNLSILSLRCNKLIEIPAEIGHLSNLKVLNLVDNRLECLPVSILKLEKLAALWLATNQSQPLVPLQPDTDNRQMVLTCFMLPQTQEIFEEYPRECNYTHHVERKRICFAGHDDDIEHSSRLTRSPTPYPKELRAMAKHVKSIQTGLTVTVNNYSQEEEFELVCQKHHIKEAKVTNTPSSPLTESECPLLENEKTDILDFKKLNIKPSESEEYIDNNQELSEPIAQNHPVLAFETSPMIREAKNIRTDTQTSGSSSSPTVKIEINKPQPPPYHIAAAYSTQAQFFINNENNLNKINKIQKENQYQHFKTSIESSTSCEPISSFSKEEMYQDLRPVDSVNSLYSEQINTSKEFIYQDLRSPSESTSYVAHTALNDRRSPIECPSLIYSNQNAFEICRPKSPVMREPKELIYQDLQQANSSMAYSFKDQEIDNLSNEISTEDYKPRTFIQDKPTPGQNVIMPKPKRPLGHETTKIEYLTRSPIQLRRADLSSNIHVHKFDDSLPLDHHFSPDVQFASGDNLQIKQISNKILTGNKVFPDKNSLLSKNKVKMPSENSLSKWMFGKHKNPTVMQVIVNKTSDIGFNITENKEGIFITSIFRDEAKSLSVGDKILEIEGVDVTKMNKNKVLDLLQSSGPSLSMMISHMV